MSHPDDISDALVDTQSLGRIYPDVESPAGLYESSERAKTLSWILGVNQHPLTPHIVERLRGQRRCEDVALEDYRIRLTPRPLVCELDRRTDVDTDRRRDGILAHQCQQEAV